MQKGCGRLRLKLHLACRSRPLPPPLATILFTFHTNHKCIFLPAAIQRQQPYLFHPLSLLKSACSMLKQYRVDLRHCHPWEHCKSRRIIAESCFMRRIHRCLRLSSLLLTQRVLPLKAVTFLSCWMLCSCPAPQQVMHKGGRQGCLAGNSLCHAGGDNYR